MRTSRDSELGKLMEKDQLGQRIVEAVKPEADQPQVRAIDGQMYREAGAARAGLAGTSSDLDSQFTTEACRAQRERKEKDAR